MRRHARQTRLAEVGPGGQAKIAAASAEVPGEGLAALVAARYLAGAGLAGLRVREAAAAAWAQAMDARVRVDVDPLLEGALPAAPSEIRDPAARQLAAGALHALGVLRSVLALGPGDQAG